MRQYRVLMAIYADEELLEDRGKGERDERDSDRGEDGPEEEGVPLP